MHACAAALVFVGKDIKPNGVRPKRLYRQMLPRS
jgi:hypothetical protein